MHRICLLGLLLLPLLGFSEPAPNLPGTGPLTETGDLSARMHQAAIADIDAKIADSIRTRPLLWRRDTSSPGAYVRSIEPNREHFRQILGLGDPRLPVRMERFGELETPPVIAETSRLRIYQVRWLVLPGITGEGLLLEPKTARGPFVVALPDADETPEQIAGSRPGTDVHAQFARRLAENGCTVIVPTLIDRGIAASGDPDILMTNQPHREWIHRQAFMMGRTLVGYELQKVMAAVDWAEQRGFGSIGVAG